MLPLSELVVLLLHVYECRLVCLAACILGVDVLTLILLLHIQRDTVLQDSLSFALMLLVGKSRTVCADAQPMHDGKQ